MSLNINTDVWGAESTWIDYSAYATAYLDAKVPQSDRDTYYKLIQSDIIPLNTDLDISQSPWGIGAGSILCKPQYISPYIRDDEKLADIRPVCNPITQLPAIMSFTYTDEGQYWQYSYRFAPARTSPPGDAVNRSYPILDFNYQKAKLYITIAAKQTQGQEDYWIFRFDDYFTNRYISYPYICGIRYYLIGIDDSGSYSDFPGFAIHNIYNPIGYNVYYGSYYFYGNQGYKILQRTGSTSNQGAWIGNPWRFYVPDSVNYTVATPETAFAYRYSQSADQGVQVYYFDPDDDRWIVNVASDDNTSRYMVCPVMLCTASTLDDVREYWMQQAAYLGFPFITTDQNGALQKKIGDSGVYLPVFDENFITTGEYLEGEDSLELPNANWGSVAEDSNYDPSYTPGGDDDGDGDVGIKVKPSTPGFTLSSKGTECYALVESDIDEIFDDIYGRDTKSWNKLIQGLQMFGSDPMGAIISFKWYPFTFTPGTSKAIYLGNTVVNALHQYPTLEGIGNSYVSSTATFKWDQKKNFVNSRHTSCRIYLPFYGFYELPISMMISKTLSVHMAYNVPDETAVWILSFDDVIYDFCECDPSIEIPLTGSNAGQIALVKRQAALSIAASVGAAATAITVAASTGLGPWISEFAKAGYGTGAAISGALGNIGGYGELAKTFGLTPITAAGAGAAGLNTYNTLQNTRVEIATLQTNLPHHGAASATTFLNLPMFPYIQFIQNVKMAGYNEGEYRLKVGHACDIWTTATQMPENSLLQTTGMADMSSAGMELAEAQELNTILQSGFYR